MISATIGHSDGEAEPRNVMPPPAPLRMDGWHDMRNGAIDVEEDAPAIGGLAP